MKRNPPPTLVVEFVGLPAAGKTTVGKRVLELLWQRGIGCHERGPMIAAWPMIRSDPSWYLRTSATEPGRVVLATRFGFSIKPWQWQRFRQLRHLLYLAQQAREDEGEDSHVLLLDQGLIQTMWAAVIGGVQSHPELTERTLESVFGPIRDRTLIVYFAAPAELAAQRIARRTHGYSRFDGRPCEEVERELQAYSHALDSLVEAATRVLGIAPLVVDAATPIEENAQQIVEFIRSRLASTP